MEQEDIKSAIIERFNNLQPEIQEAIMNSNYENNISEIGQKHGLTTEQLGELEFNTTLVLLGQTHPDEYQNELFEDLKVTEEKVKEIVGDVNENILKNIRALLIKNFEDEKIVFDPNFSGLPQNVQEAIANSNWKEKLYEIAGKYKLTVSQMGILEEITVRVMNNEIKPSLYENELATKIVILREDITKLVADVNEEILKRIREVMREQGEISEQPKKEIQNQVSDDIPLPPYKKDDEEKIPEPPKKIDLEIKNIEKIEEAPKNIMEDKLKGVVASDHTVSNYSIPNINEPKTEEKPKSFDPYREAF